MFSDIQPPDFHNRHASCSGWYDSTAKHWPEIAHKSQAENVEQQFMTGMTYDLGLAGSLRSFFSRVGDWITTTKQDFWRAAMGQSGSGQKTVYRIKIKETINRSIAYLMGEVMILPQENGETVLVGSFIDQSALRGLMDQLWNLNFTVISIESVDGGIQATFS